MTTTQKKTRTKNVRTWTTNEEVEIASYVTSYPYLWKNQAKETYSSYLRKIITSLSFQNFDLKQLDNKLTQMKMKYKTTYKWTQETDQGVKDVDPDNFSEFVKQRCRYFYIVNDLWGSSQAIATSYQRDSGIPIHGETSEAAECIIAITPPPSSQSQLPDEEDNMLCNYETKVPIDKTITSSLGRSARKFEESISKRDQSKVSKSGGSKVLNFLEERQLARSDAEKNRLNGTLSGYPYYILKS